jgi:hypothetical protein
METVEPAWPSSRRVAHLRERAAMLRIMAEGEPFGRLRHDLLNVAEKYEELAISIEATAVSEP